MRVVITRFVNATMRRKAAESVGGRGTGSRSMKQLEQLVIASVQIQRSYGVPYIRRRICTPDFAVVVDGNKLGVNDGAVLC